MRPLSRLLGALFALRPRNAAALVALAVIGAAFGYLFSQETPIGRIRGQVILSDLKRPLGDVEVYLTPTGKGQPDRHVRYAMSGENGRFLFDHVPAGEYQVAATTRAHASKEVRLTVYEGGTTPLTLMLNRSESELEMKEHQRVYGTGENAHLAVSGYVDGKKPIRRDAMHVRVFSTRLSTILQNADASDALDQVGNSYDPPSALPAVLLQPHGGRAPQRVLDTNLPITQGDKEGFFYQQIDFGRLPTGLYLVDVAHTGKTVCAWVLVTDTALVVKRAHRQMLAYVVDMQSGTPLPDASVRAYTAGKAAAQGQTDARGLTTLTLPAEKPHHPAGNSEESGPDETHYFIIASRGTDEAVLNNAVYQSEEAGAYVVHAYTDRPIYRPGQRIYFKGIARRPVAHPTDTGPRYSVPADEPVQVEIRDPSGDRLLDERLTTNRFGSFAGDLDLSPEAPTGSYTLVTSVGGEKHTQDIRVASYRKPEFSVTVTPDRSRYNHGDTITMNVSAEFYFGVPVAGAQVSYDVYSAPDWSAEYPDDYDLEEDEQNRPPPHFSDGESYYGQTITDGKATLDENGKAVITFQASDRDDVDGPQAETYTVNVTVTEGEDREATADGTARVTAGDFRLSVSPEGYVAMPGRPATVQILAEDYDRKPISNVPISLEIGYEEWQDGNYHFTPVGTQQAVTGPDGRVTVEVTPPRAGELLMKAHATDSEQHAILGRADLWAASDAGGDLDTEYADLSLLTDKRHYQPGDTARVLINAARAGETVLLTIEGQQIYSTQLVMMKQRSTIVRLPVLARYGPNVFLVACYVRDKHFAKSEAPLRVAMPQQQLKLSITPDRAPPSSAPNVEPSERPTPDAQRQTPDANTLPRYGPDDKITYHVQATDSQGRPAVCEFSLGVVDESIYALREDDPNALRDDFYPHQENAVDTSYSFAIVYLGDEDKSEPKITARKRFPDTAFWQPFLQTDAQGLATVSLTLPDNLTTWRATVKAATADTKLGYAITKVIAAKDFLVRVETPRFLTQRDGSRLVAFVHNDTGAPQTALVRLRAINLAVIGAGTQRLQIAPGQAAEAVWPVQADGYGTAGLRVTAWTLPANGARQYTDGVELQLPIRPHGREQVTAFAGELTAANPETEVLRLDPQAIPGVSRLTVRITPSIATALTGGLDYLIGFPYGCTEQTMSRFLPDLLAQRALQRHGYTHLPQAQDLSRMVRDGLQRLYRFQHTSADNEAKQGWGWWEHDEDDPWMTSYVLYGLATAQAEGYPVRRSVLESGRKAALGMFAKADPEDRPFLLYVVALAGDRPGARAHRDKIDMAKLGPEGLAYLILLDKLLGKTPSPAQAMLDAQAISADAMLHWGAQQETRWQIWDWDDQEATAIGLCALLAENPNDPRIGLVLRWLMSQRTGEYWESTRDTAFVLAAFCDYLTSRPPETATGDIAVRLNGRLIRTVPLTADVLQEKEIVLHVPASELRPDKNDVTLERAGGASPVFYSVELRQTVASDDLPALTVAHFAVKREYLRLLPHKIGEESWQLDTEPTNNALRQGDNIRVRLTLTVPRDMAYVLIEDPFPAGCTIEDQGDAGDIDNWDFWWSSQDVRDDRIAFFTRLLPKGTHVIEYNLRAQTPGRYNALPTLLQAMYAPDTRSESEEAHVEIK
ncbi:MAG TPA: MG2 domain-containing protein [Chthonomonadaceae bacterium]|nr:MG2 domain-containing protein [Chthonomonadaceae bacterium]